MIFAKHFVKEKLEIYLEENVRKHYCGKGNTSMYLKFLRLEIIPRCETLVLEDIFRNLIIIKMTALFVTLRAPPLHQPFLRLKISA